MSGKSPNQWAFHRLEGRKSLAQKHSSRVVKQAKWAFFFFLFFVFVFVFVFCFLFFFFFCLFVCFGSVLRKIWH